ncbi:HDOD domain-containing protein, partial [bacterium]|nr:HDOD domain-containing protein [bacterium]
MILDQIDRLPTLPAVAVHLLALTTSRESSARQVVELVSSDASLTAEILRLVRRADLGIRNEITS